jgi:hypothetical protein
LLLLLASQKGIFFCGVCDLQVAICRCMCSALYAACERVDSDVFVFSASCCEAQVALWILLVQFWWRMTRDPNSRVIWRLWGCKLYGRSLSFLLCILFWSSSHTNLSQEIGYPDRDSLQFPSCCPLKSWDNTVGTQKFVMTAYALIIFRIKLGWYAATF